MTEKSRDIILLIGEGGMLGAFTAGALKVLDQKRSRVKSVYATSSGACAAAYFVSDQIVIAKRFFLKHLVNPQFISGKLLQYIYKIFAPGDAGKNIPDFVNLGYVVSVAKSSGTALNLQAVADSPIDFFVKVLDIQTTKTTYISAREDVFKKLCATSQCGPYSTQSVEIDGKRYIDGGTLKSDIDSDLIKRNPDTTFVYIQPSHISLASKIILYPFYIFASVALARLYGASIGWKFLTGLFRDTSKQLESSPNVIVVRNKLGGSAFTQDVGKLTKLYEHGEFEANRALRRLSSVK